MAGPDCRHITVIGTRRLRQIKRDALALALHAARQSDAAAFSGFGVC
jgi:hypothetical protein